MGRNPAEPSITPSSINYTAGAHAQIPLEEDTAPDEGHVGKSSVSCHGERLGRPPEQLL